jgi:hypothetical protein
MLGLGIDLTNAVRRPLTGATLPVIALSTASVSHAEGASGTTTFVYTVTRTGDLTGSSSAAWAVTGSGANPANAADFVGGVLPSGTVNFAAGASSATITVNVAGDSSVEPDESFTVTLSSPVNATLGTSTGTGTITNDDSAALPVIGFSTTTLSFPEGNSGTTSYVYTITRAGDTSGTSSVAWAVTGSGANPAAAADFSGGVLPSGTVTFAPGDTSKTITVSVAGESTVETDEAFTVTLSSPVNATLGTSTAAGTITNDDTQIALTTLNLTQAEGNSGTTNFVYTLTRTGNLSGTSSVNWAVTGSGANPANAADFVGGVLPSGTVTFAAGDVTKTITVPVAGDSTAEPVESFTLTLSSPAGAALGTSTAAGTITNDDSAAAPPVIMLVAAGQSNVVGVNASEPGIDTDQTDIYQWNRHTNSISSDITPLIHVIEETDTVSPAVSAAIQMKADNPTAKIVIVPVAQSTTSIIQSVGLWLSSPTPGGGHSLFENMCTVSSSTYTAIQAMFPGSAIDVRFHWEQGESDTAGPTYSQYLTGLEDLINNARSRIPGANSNANFGGPAPFVIGSMLFNRWTAGAGGFNQGYADVNRAHVQASLDLANVWYVAGPKVTSPDNLHYQPAATARDMGTRMGTVYTDVIGPSMTGATAMSATPSQKLTLALSCNDPHATIHINGGAGAAQFEISDPYLTPTLRWVGDGTSPALGTYQVGIRARDGKGNFGPTVTYTITVSATVSPVTFFTSGERGMVWDLTDLSSLFQDTAGTIPVTAAGQSVAKVLDKSGNNNHWVGAAGSTTWPIYQVDSDGKPYLQFDGTNDALHTATPFIATNDGRHTVCVGTFGAAPAAQKSIMGAYCSTGSTIFVEPLDTATSGGGVNPQYRNDASATVVGPSLAGMLDGATKRVMTSAYAGSSGVSRIRDAQSRPVGGGSSSGYASTTTTVLAQNFTLLNRATMGARGFSTISGQFAGRVYSGGAIGRFLVDTEVKNFEDWVASRTIAAALP